MLIFAILSHPRSFWFILTSLVFFYLENDYFKVIFSLKAILYDAKNDSKCYDVAPLIFRD